MSLSSSARHSRRVCDSSGLRDGQHETDGLTIFSWVHTFNPSTFLQVSPYYHYNSANYKPNPNDLPVATTSDRASNYAGLQASISTQIARNNLQAGIFTFGQHNHYTFGSIFNDGSAQSFLTNDAASGGLVEGFISDNYKVTPWLTLIAGLRQSWLRGDFTEKVTSPRVGAAIQIRIGVDAVDGVRVRKGNAPLAGSWVGMLDGFVNAQIQPQVSSYLVERKYFGNIFPSSVDLASSFDQLKEGLDFLSPSLPRSSVKYYSRTSECFSSNEGVRRWKLGGSGNSGRMLYSDRTADLEVM